jgi:N-acetylmuramoyl-L-alanine amidase
VVFDFDRIGKYTRFYLTSPFRIVFDIYRQAEFASRARQPREPEPLAEPGNPPGGHQPAGTGAPSIARQLGLGVHRIVIDPGHGGKDPGAVGRDGLFEKTVTLAIAKEIKKELEKTTGVRVMMTREEDVFMPLEMRTKIANEAGGKLFISIHADSNPNKGLRGHTVYFLGPAKTEEARRAAQFENSVIHFEESQEKYADLSDASFILAANAQNSYNKESQEIATMVDNSVNMEAKSASHGVRQAGFYVLYGASMPNILLESAFISNKNDEKLLKNKDFYKSIARALSKSVLEFKKKYENEL